MIKLSRRKIMELIPNRLTFARSENYFIGNRVHITNYNSETRTYYSQVVGTKQYDVEVEFNANGEFYDGDCNCPAFDGFNYCKHIGATLFELMSRPYKLSRFISKEEEEAKKIIEHFGYVDSTIKQNLNLEVNFEYVRSDFIDDKDTAVSLRIGEDKLYIVKSVKKFLKSLVDNEELYFGKNFSFDPRIHSFREVDKPLIDMLLDLYDSEELLNNMTYYGKNQSLLSGKKVYMPDRMVKRFFNIMNTRTFNCRIDDVEYSDIEIHDGDIDVDFLLTKDGESLNLNIDFGSDIVPLVKDGSYVYTNNKIYKLSKYQAKNIAPFYKGLNIAGEKIIKIPKKYNERFISEVYPIIKNIGKIEVDDKVEDSLYNPGLRAEVYLDKKEEKILASIKFQYGDIVIKAIENGDSRTYDNRIILRDVEREREIISFFELSKFKVSKSGLYLEDEEDTFDFVYKKLPRLQTIADIYYSESFKNMRVYSSNYYSGGVRLNNKGLLEFSFSIDGIDSTEIGHVFDSISEKRQYYRLKNGSFLSLDDKELIDIHNLWNYLDIDMDDYNGEAVELPKYRALYIDEHLKDGNVESIRRNLKFKSLVQNMREPNDIEYEVPKTVDPILRGYQRFGFKWLKTLDTYDFGGILADDMGLGKTVQMLSFLSSIREDKEKTAIIVAPTSLVYNWLYEIEKFTPELNTLIIVGKKEERTELIKSIKDYNVVITSYPLIRRDIELYEDIEFEYCILDEAQHIKNHMSQNAKSVKALKSKRRFALTGTPIENSLTELWSIFDFIMPGYLLNHSKFLQKFERPITKERDPVALVELGRYISPFVLRRIKQDVLRELPDKIEHKVVSQLTSEQKKIYLAYLQEIKGEIEEEIATKGFASSHIKILAGLTRLRQICCHPSMFIDGYDGGSGKLDLAMELINESINGGHRILLFSQFTSMLGLLRESLDLAGIEYKYLDGSTKVKERGRLVKDFNNGEGDVFLISLKAGGTGLNLTGADTVIHFDPWWNPAVENQATDRAHRIGQNKVVHVIKLVAKGTIEEKILELQDKKKQLIESVMKPGDTLITKLSEDEIKSLFHIDL